MYLVSLKGGHSRPLFLYYRLSIQLTANIFSLLKLLMAGFEPESSGFGSDCSANCAPLRKVGRRFFKKGHSRPLFLYFRLFNTVDSKQMFNIKDCRWLDSIRGSLVSVVGSDRSTNWATTTALGRRFYIPTIHQKSVPSELPLRLVDDQLSLCNDELEGVSTSDWCSNELPSHP